MKNKQFFKSRFGNSSRSGKTKIQAEDDVIIEVVRALCLWIRFMVVCSWRQQGNPL